MQHVMGGESFLNLGSLLLPVPSPSSTGAQFSQSSLRLHPICILAVLRTGLSLGRRPPGSTAAWAWAALKNSVWSPLRFPSD